MPGFNVCGSGSGPSATVETRRVYRFQMLNLGMNANNQFSAPQLLFLQSASRPNFKFKTAEMHHNQEVATFAGKQEWEPCSLKWYDTEQSPDCSAGIYAWLECVVNFATANVSPPSSYKQQATLAMVNGAGQPTEQWMMCNTWPETVDWGDGDYTGTDICVIEATMRYDRATRSCLTAPAPTTYGPTCGTG